MKVKYAFFILSYSSTTYSNLIKIDEEYSQTFLYKWQDLRGSELIILDGRSPLTRDARGNSRLFGERDENRNDPSLRDVVSRCR